MLNRAIALFFGMVFIPGVDQVPEVVIVVKGEKPVLITEGEVLVGGWQNRTVNISLLLEAGKKHRIPVSCVEQERWRPSYPRPSHSPTCDEMAIYGMSLEDRSDGIITTASHTELVH